MSVNDPSRLQRREFLQAGAVASAAALSMGSPSLGDEPNASKPTLPTRKLGKTGVDVTIVNQGTWRCSGVDRLIRLSYATGVRCFDTAAAYGSEPNFKKWFAEQPEVRKSIFLVSKTMARNVDQFVTDLDKRLEATGTDHLDLYFWHAMGDHREEVAFAKSPEFARAIEKIKKSGKAKFVGFSTHNVRRAEFIQAAAEGGFIEVIMVQYSPSARQGIAARTRYSTRPTRSDIVLISMKQSAGQFGDARGMAELDTCIETVTKLAKESSRRRPISPIQGQVQGIWTDEFGWRPSSSR